MPDLADFAGEWTLLRRIRDRRSGTLARLSGRARFAARDAGLEYREHGTLNLGGGIFVANRTYLWRRDGPLITVAFGDGRPFHHFDPWDGAPCAAHDCAPDTYGVRYAFGRWPAWRTVWTVTGPGKDYVSVSAYRRLRSVGASGR